MIKFKMKPKVVLAKLFKNKKIEFDSIDTELKYETNIDDVTFKAEVKADLNYQESNLGLDSIKSASFSFTKKF